MRLLSLFSVLLLGSVALVGCGETADTTTSDTPKPILTSVNETCPIMGGDVTADGGSVDFNGKEVGFCCPGCIDKWKELPDDDKAAKLATADSDHADGHEDHGDHGHSDHGDEPAAG